VRPSATRAEAVTVVVVGAGAAGIARTVIMPAQGVGDVVVCNRRGALYAGAEHLDAERTALAERTNARGLRGTPDEALPAPTC
jgi:malate dehydrogenase (oxaloacetate-decarboxylating)